MTSCDDMLKMHCNLRKHPHNAICVGSTRTTPVDLAGSHANSSVVFLPSKSASLKTGRCGNPLITFYGQLASDGDPFDSAIFSTGYTEHRSR